VLLVGVHDPRRARALVARGLHRADREEISKLLMIERPQRALLGGWAPMDNGLLWEGEKIVLDGRAVVLVAGPIRI
jgi:hypothetical protein